MLLINTATSVQFAFGFRMKMMFVSTLIALASIEVASAIAASNSASDQQDWSGVECPHRCQCTMRYFDRFVSYLRTVDCSHLALSYLPDRLPIDTQALILSDNRIRYPFENPVWLPELVVLDLSRNRITAMNGQRRLLFDGIYNLRVLDLSRNQLSTLADDAFRGLFNLEELNLAENRVGHLDEHALRGLLKLETLKLSSNRLSYLQSGWWRHVRTLYDLALDGNYFSVVQSDSFRHLDNLLGLDLSRNKLFRVSDDAFASLRKLETLALHGNTLTSVPRQALAALRSSLKSLDLSRNPILAVCTDDLANFGQLKDVRFNGMQRMRLVERGAFKNLAELLIVEMHDNPYLAYVDATAFVNTRQLTHLLLHNNNLTVLEREVVEALPSLEEMSFYGNPLTCDCNVGWLHDAVLAPARPGQARIRFPESSRLVCDGPAEHRFKLFSGLRRADLGTECLRMLDNLFDEHNTRKIGDDITYRCRAVGWPKPRLSWTAPPAGSSPIDAAVYHPRRVIYNGDTLVVRRIKPEDAGQYRCVAENSAGEVEASTELRVSSIQMQLRPSRIGSTTVTLAWNGTESSNHVFQILLRRAVERRRQYAATVTPLMRSYTVYNLQPGTEYEACMTLVDGDDVVVNISCSSFATGSLEASAYKRMERTGNVAVGAALGIVACMLIVLGLAAVAVKRSRSQQRLGGHHDAELGLNAPPASPGAVSHVTFYSVDNIYSPLLPSSSLCKHSISSSTLRIGDDCRS